MSDVYTYLEGGFHLDKIEDLPDERWLENALDVLWGGDEFLFEPIRNAIRDSVESVTYDEFGRLIYWAENARLAAEAISEHIAEIVSSLHQLMINNESPRETAGVAK